MKKFCRNFISVSLLVVVVAVAVKAEEARSCSPQRRIFINRRAIGETTLVSLTPTDDSHYLTLKVEKLFFSCFNGLRTLYKNE
jgi:hypothetical protein